jgi:hypothetical protein
VAGGWDDEDVGRAVLDALGLDDNGKPIDAAIAEGLAPEQ